MQLLTTLIEGLHYGVVVAWRVVELTRLGLMWSKYRHLNIIEIFLHFSVCRMLSEAVRCGGLSQVAKPQFT